VYLTIGAGAHAHLQLQGDGRTNRLNPSLDTSLAYREVPL
jgi:hypothetical protein